LIPLISGLIVAWGVNRGLRPLTKLADHAQKLDADNLQNPFDTANLPGEVEPIAQRFNELLTRIDTVLERERRFNADLAHELRTPLAEARTSLEVAKRWPAPDMQQNALDSLAQLEALVSALLVISRGKTPHTSRSREAINLAEAVQDAWDVVTREHDELQSRGLEIHSDKPMTVNTDKMVLGRILQNLLTNAVDYGMPGETIICMIFQRSGVAILEISNKTDLIAADDIHHVFDSFWRKDPSRTGDNHRGLGLTLVKSFCQIINVQITAELAKPNIFKTTITFAAPSDNLKKATVDIKGNVNQGTIDI
jgi:signal transduction histidine kinase